MKRLLLIPLVLLLAIGAAGDGEPVYRSPSALAVVPGGELLAVTCSGSDSLLLLELPSGRIKGEVTVGRAPSAVAVSEDGKTAWVANRDGDDVSVVDLETLEVTATLPSGWAPMDLVVTDGRLFVANALSRNVSVVDLATGVEVKRLRAGESPQALALAPDGRLYVANLLSTPHPPTEPPVPEVTVIDTRSATIVDRLALPGANIVQDVAVAADGRVFLPLLRPKNLVPLIQVAGGWSITNGLGYVTAGGDARQLLVDVHGHYHADPTAVALDGGTAWVAIGGANRVIAVDQGALAEAAAIDDPYLADRLDLAARYVGAEVPTGHHPVDLALDAASKRLYVADRLGDTVTVIDTASRRRVATFDLGGAEAPDPTRRGEQLFYNGEATFHAEFSCATCHPAGRHDGLVYDISPDGLGKNLVDTRTMLGLRGTAPFKWSGLNPDLHTQCGPRAAKFIMRSPGFTPEELDDVVAYMANLPLPKNRHHQGDGRLTPVQAWGQRVFEREVDNTGQPIPPANRCNFCHPGPRFTNNRAFDVGTAAPHDKSGLFDTPTLNGLLETPPYLHDGRATSLEELWTVYNKDDRHGRANDLGKDELNALIEYLKTL